ncbi:MAG: universal stress protein [Acidimicrobiales bacterium]|jgi:nucleotide-binding universal stress UspA family protein
MARVLIATDGSDVAVAAAERAVALLGPSCAYALLAVVPPPASDFLAPGTGDMAVVGGIGAGGLGAAAYVPEVAERQAAAFSAEAHKMLERTAAALPEALDVEHRIEQGDPASVICEVAAEGNFDVITLGSHGTGFVRRLLLGSVSHHVLHHAPCPVLVMREADHGHPDDSSSV